MLSRSIKLQVSLPPLRHGCVAAIKQGCLRLASASRLGCLLWASKARQRDSQYVPYVCSVSMSLICCAAIAATALQLRGGGGLVSCSRAMLLTTTSGTLPASARNASGAQQVSSEGGNFALGCSQVLC
jgi:hypothetical protein